MHEHRDHRTHARRPLRETLSFLATGLGPAPHVLFVGMAFFWRRELTVDLDEGRLTVS